MTFGLLFELISKKRGKTNQDKIRKLEGNYTKRKLLNNTVIIIVCLVKTMFCSYIDYKKFNRGEERFFGDEDLLSIIMFFVVGLLSVFCLNQYFYKHHLVYTIIIIIGIVGKILSNKTFTLGFIQDSFLFLLGSILIAGEIVVEKWLLDVQFISPYFLVGLMGVFSIIVFFIIFIFNIILKDINIIECDLKDFAVIALVVKVIINITFFCGYNIIMTLVIKDFGPLNKILINMISEFLVLITGFFGETLSLKSSIFLIVSHLIVLFGVFGYNELFIIHVFKLDYNTRKMIMKRANDCELQIEFYHDKKKGPLLTDC
jgi:hypothetical protein